MNFFGVKKGFFCFIVFLENEIFFVKRVNWKCFNIYIWLVLYNNFEWILKIVKVLYEFVNEEKKYGLLFYIMIKYGINLFYIMLIKVF